MTDTPSHRTNLCPPPLDPRTASTQSLTPSHVEGDQCVKRRLLVIYIHGFVGSEASFHSFPFHVHMRLKEKLTATHAIHSKIYPRYKTYKAFHLATANLSNWLSAHEDANTDIVLVGHSMGGLLAEEVVLLRDTNDSSRKHKILGIVHMDAPLLGARNRVILAGVLSPFRSKAGVFTIPRANASGVSLDQLRSTEALSTDTHPSDPLFNPPFANDVLIQTRSWWENVQHFARKHRDQGFIPASFNHWVDHFEFGSCLLNSKRLREQYHALRKLDGAESGAAKGMRAERHERVRFVQFYTASYKGRAGKRYIEKAYMHGNERSETSVIDGRFVSLKDEESGQNAKKPQTNDDVEGHIADLGELCFCRLARQSNGEVDPLWKKIMVATNDEVNAHTILFMPGPHYESLVERACNEIAEWIVDSNA